MCTATVPFAAVTWWSVVTPLIAVLIIATGTSAMATSAGVSAEVTAS